MGALVLAEQEHIGEEGASLECAGPRPCQALEVASSTLNRAQKLTGIPVPVCANYSMLFSVYYIKKQTLANQSDHAIGSQHGTENTVLLLPINCGS